MKATLLSLTLIVLAGCATAPPVDAPAGLFADPRFAPPSVPVSTQNLFTLSPEMLRFAQTKLAASVARRGPQVGLFEAVRNELRIDYNTATTGTAAETFAARSGNCLSLVILTAAFAKHLEVPVTYQSVYTDDTWSRSNGIAFVAGHVNLVLGTRRRDLATPTVNPLAVDFVPPESLGRFFSKPLSEDVIAAMYLNNRAAEALVAGELDEAYWLARASILQAPSFTNAYNTLGVIYQRHGDLGPAEFTLRAALEREPTNFSALSNLAGVLERQGRTEEAAQLRQQLAELTPYPPFYFLDQGLAALVRGENQAALDLLERELRRMPYDDEVHFAIAVADLRLGNLNLARRHLAQALEANPVEERRAIYAAKLSALRAQTPANALQR